MTKKLLLYLLKIYSICISPMLPRTCRFYPSCSEYSREAILKHGSLKGLALSFLRILRCNRFSSGGADPVP